MAAVEAESGRNKTAMLSGAVTASVGVSSTTATMLPPARAAQAVAAFGGIGTFSRASRLVGQAADDMSDIQDGDIQDYELAHEIAAHLISRLGPQAKPHVEKILAAHRALGDQGDADTWEQIAQAIEAILSGHAPR
jgi:hypothetical protein